MIKAYTYFVGWTKLNKFYYGVRYAKGCSPEDLFVTYFTSCKGVHNLIGEHGNPDLIEVRKTFENIDRAREWEHRVLRRLKVIEKDFWINKSDNKSICPIAAGSVEWTDSMRKKASVRMVGNQIRKGSKDSETTIIRKREAKLGKKRPEHSKKMFNRSPRARSVIINGVKYHTIAEASRHTSLSYHVINKMIEKKEIKQYAGDKRLVRYQ